MMRKYVGVATAIIGATVVAGCSSTTSGSATSLNPATASGGASGSGSASASSASSQPSPSSAAANAPSTFTDALESRVVNAMNAATSFRVAGSINSGGMAEKLDMHLSGANRAAGTVVVDGVSLQVINPGGASVYLKAPDSFWDQAGANQVTQLLHGKWVKETTADPGVSDIQSFTKATLVSQVESSIDEIDLVDMKLVGPATVNGTAAIEYRAASDGSEVYLAATGAPVILKVVDSTSDGGSLTLSGYGEKYSVAAPAASKTVDLDKLEQSAVRR